MTMYDQFNINVSPLQGRKLSTSHQAVMRTKHDEIQYQINVRSLDWSHKIPNELLQKIFMYAVSSSSAVPLLCRLENIV